MTETEPATQPEPAPRTRPKHKGRYIVAVGGCVVAVVAIIVIAFVLAAMAIPVQLLGA